MGFTRVCDLEDGVRYIQGDRYPLETSGRLGKGHCLCDELILRGLEVPDRL